MGESLETQRGKAPLHAQIGGNPDVGRIEHSEIRRQRFRSAGDGHLDSSVDEVNPESDQCETANH